MGGNTGKKQQDAEMNRKFILPKDVQESNLHYRNNVNAPKVKGATSDIKVMANSDQEDSKLRIKDQIVNLVDKLKTMLLKMTEVNVLTSEEKAKVFEYFRQLSSEEQKVFMQQLEKIQQEEDTKPIIERIITRVKKLSGRAIINALIQRTPVGSRSEQSRPLFTYTNPRLNIK